MVPWAGSSGKTLSGSWWTICGLISDAFGATLLSAEAIKLANVRHFADMLEEHVWLPLEYPLMVIGDPHDESVAERQRAAIGPENAKRGFWGHLLIYDSAHLVIGWLSMLTIWRVVLTVFDVNIWYAATDAIDSLWIVLTVVIYILGAILFLYVSYLIGELVIQTIMAGSVRRFIKFLNFIERNGPNGTTGMIGLGFLLAGFGGQMMGTILN